MPNNIELNPVEFNSFHGRSGLGLGETGFQKNLAFDYEQEPSPEPPKPELKPGEAIFQPDQVGDAAELFGGADADSFVSMDKPCCNKLGRITFWDIKSLKNTSGKSGETVAVPKLVPDLELVPVLQKPKSTEPAPPEVLKTLNLDFLNSSSSAGNGFGFINTCWLVEAITKKKRRTVVTSSSDPTAWERVKRSDVPEEYQQPDNWALGYRYFMRTKTEVEKDLTTFGGNSYVNEKNIQDIDRLLAGLTETNVPYDIDFGTTHPDKIAGVIALFDSMTSDLVALTFAGLVGGAVAGTKVGAVGGPWSAGIGFSVGLLAGLAKGLWDEYRATQFAKARRIGKQMKEFLDEVGGGDLVAELHVTERVLVRLEISKVGDARFLIKTDWIEVDKNEDTYCFYEKQIFLHLEGNQPCPRYP